jgi:hypothetical protein
MLALNGRANERQTHCCNSDEAFVRRAKRRYRTVAGTTALFVAPHCVIDSPPVLRRHATFAATVAPTFHTLLLALDDHHIPFERGGGPWSVLRVVLVP